MNQETNTSVKNKPPRSRTRGAIAVLAALLLATGSSLAGGIVPVDRGDTITPGDTTRHSRDNFREKVTRREREAINRDNATREAMSELRAWWEATRLQPSLPPVAPRRYIAVKTNLATWAVTAINAAVEVQVGPRLSVDLPVAWCPWDVSRDHAARFLLFQPEARRWFDRPGKGHFVGLHAHLGWFNVKWDDNRYQDTTRPLLGAGLAYGYALPLGRHWGAEFAIGGGYANMKYHTYYNITNGARFDTRVTNYWGITRLGINLVYNFNSK